MKVQRVHEAPAQGHTAEQERKEPRTLTLVIPRQPGTLPAPPICCTLVKPLLAPGTLQKERVQNQSAACPVSHRQRPSLAVPWQPCQAPS